MKIQIDISGHQYSQTYVGEVIQWASTVVMYSNPGTIYYSVPSVTLRLDNSQEIKVIPLKEQYRDSKITVLEEAVVFEKI